MKVEDILKKLIEANEDEVSQLYSDGRKVLLDYITTLQRKEYNNSKAIKYIKFTSNLKYEDEYVGLFIKDVCNNLLNILEKENRI